MPKESKNRAPKNKKYMNKSIPISIVTSCYNCEQYIEATIRSVIQQDFPDLQYIITDGASSDRTLDIIKKYREDIDVLISEPDEGMYHGIQKGFQYAQGEIMAWLNADDIYYTWTFSIVERIFLKFPEVEWIIGLPTYMNQIGQCIKVSSNAGTVYPRNYISNGWFRPQLAGYLQQESMFWRKSLWDKVGGLNLKLKFAADFELWTRFAKHAELYSITVPLASFRKRPGEQRSSVEEDKYHNEVMAVCQNLKPPPKIWDFVSRGGEIGRILSRLLIWKNCNFITYSLREKDWVMKKAMRPLSRYSLAEVLLDWITNRLSPSILNLR
ncbi:MAG: glycosyltransferase [Deltaproteobacteria bacterium]|nr:glycosyltransferase [Deltaproteobacteria bacterium]